MPHIFLVLFFTLFMTSQASASLPPIEGSVLLTITGEIRYTNQEDRAEFDLQLLESLEQQQIITQNPWIAGSNVYRGPLGRALIKAVGAEQASLMRITSLNGYITEIPVSDFMKYDIIFALQKNGETLKIRDRGPLFVIYPFNQHPHLNTQKHYNRSAWQVKSIEFI